MYLVVLALQEIGSFMSPTSLQQLEVKGADLRAALARIGDMRPGSLSETYGKCGKPTCHCAKSGSPGHGPSWLLTRTVDGKTVAQRIPSGPAVEQSKQQVAEYKRFRALARELIEISDQICDLRLRDLEGLREVETKKNAIAASLQGEIAREIEELFGSQSMEAIDFEALETALRRPAAGRPFARAAIQPRPFRLPGQLVALCLWPAGALCRTTMEKFS